MNGTGESSRPDGDHSPLDGPSGQGSVNGGDFPSSGSLLGIDWGEKRVGLSLSDPLWRFSWPVEPVVRGRTGLFSAKNDPSLLKVLRSIIREEEVAGLVFGVPYYHLSGDTNPKAALFVNTGRDLSRELALPVFFWDEGLSSETARQDPSLKRPKQKPGKRIERDPWIDSRSAALILESFLTANRSSRKSGTIETVQNGKEDSES